MLRSQSAYFRNHSSRRWFVDSPRWQTKCSAASWSALIAFETSFAFSSLKKCCSVTEWKRSKMQWIQCIIFSRSVSSLFIFKISLEPQYSPIEINFCESTFGHVLGNEVIHRIRFHHIFEFLFFIQFIDFRARSRYFLMFLSIELRGLVRLHTQCHER